MADRRTPAITSRRVQIAAPLCSTAGARTKGAGKERLQCESWAPGMIWPESCFRDNAPALLILG